MDKWRDCVVTDSIDDFAAALEASGMRFVKDKGYEGMPPSYSGMPLLESKYCAPGTYVIFDRNGNPTVARYK